MPHFAPALTTRTELNIELLDDLYLATVQSIEEAVVNALVAGEDVPTVKPEGMTCRALDTDRLQAIFAAKP
jgi:L-aminopeptidase/D-esterase-like protein